MKLDRLILINWGQLNPGNYDMGDMTLLTGETGSGKSTMLDSLQTVMTAAYKGILNYNPGQDEVSQNQRRGKSKRSLESYIVGAEYSLFSRPAGAQGFIAAVFRPSEGETVKPFTALIGASARVDGTGDTRQAVLEHSVQVIIDDEMLSFEDFMIDVATGECRRVDTIVKHLQSRYNRVTDYHDKKRDYLCGLYGRFRGKNSVSWDEASNAAKAWVGSIAYRPIGSVHELVRDEILDFDGKQLQQDIERIGGLMRQVTNLRAEGQRLSANVSRLDALKSVIGSTTAAFEQTVTQDLLVAKVQLNFDTQTIAAKERQVSDQNASLAVEDVKIKGWTERLKTQDERRIELQARLLGIPVHTQKQDLDHKLKQASAQARATLTELASSLMAAGLLEQKATALMNLALPKELVKLKAAIGQVGQALSKTELPRLGALHEQVLQAGASEELSVERLVHLVGAFNGLDRGIDLVHAALVGPDDSVALAVSAELTLLEQRTADATRAVKEASARKARLAGGGMTYPNYIEVALDRLRARYPEANAQVLCDLVEPKSLDWQQAIEGFMGKSRFNLIVDEAWEAKALDFCFEQKSGLSVVQGAQCRLNGNKTLPPDSIVNELKASNPLAWAYLVDVYGTVVKVNTTEELRRTRRGLMKNGNRAGNRTMTPGTEHRDLVFGIAAREQALEKAGVELTSAEAALGVLATLKASLDAAKRMLQGLREPRFDAAPLGTAANTIEQCRCALSGLDLSEMAELTDEVELVSAEMAVFKGHIEASQKLTYGLESSVKAATAAIAQMEASAAARHEAVARQSVRVKALALVNPALSSAILHAQVQAQLDEKPITLDDARREAERLAKLPERLLGDVREALSEYNSASKPDERFVAALPHLQDSAAFDANYEPLVKLVRAVGTALDGLRSLGLYDNRTELDKAVRSFHDVFTKQFCVEIKSRVDDGVRTLRQMNNELKNLKFGSDRFSIDWSRWEPEFKEYLGFFEAVTLLADSSEAVDLFGEVDMAPEHLLMRDKLVKLLLDDDQEKASKELLRIADYRNYRRYDILNESDTGGTIRLSEWGTGSGGQLETPAYIVRAAVVTNRLKLFEKGPSLKLLVNDESFAKMDEPRARAVLGFMRDNLQLQLMSAMPTMKAGALKDEFTREYSFTRLSPVKNGELEFMSEVDERVFKNDKMRELWAHQRVTAREKSQLAFELEEARNPTPSVHDEAPAPAFPDA